MGRRRKAWLVAKTGILHQRGRRLPGYYARFSEYSVDGRRVNRSRHFPTAKAAADWVRRYNARLDLNELEQVVPVTIREAHEEFSAATISLSPGTRRHYDSAIGLLLAVIGDMPVCKVRGAHIDGFIGVRLQHSSPATVAKHLRGLHRFFAWAASSERRYAVNNPVDAATTRLGRVASVSRKPSITDRQLALLFDALDTPDRRLAMLLAITTGLDRGVITALSTQQIDLESGVIHCIRPKTHRPIAVPIHPHLVSALADKLVPGDPARPILAGLQRQSRRRDWWVRATALAGVPGLQFRHLRALAATRLQRLGGASLRDAQALLGHSSPLTTARHYHVPDPSIVQALARTPLPGFPGPTTPRIVKYAGDPHASGHPAAS